MLIRLKNFCFVFLYVTTLFTHFAKADEKSSLLNSNNDTTNTEQKSIIEDTSKSVSKSNDSKSQTSSFFEPSIEVLDYYDIQEDGSFPSLYVDYGLNIIANNDEENIQIGLLGSRFLGLSLCYNLVIPKSHFALQVGMAYSNRTLSFDEKDSSDKKSSEYFTIVRDNDELRSEIKNAKDVIWTKNGKIKPTNSYLNFNTWGFIIGAKFFANKIFPKDSFVCSVSIKFDLPFWINTEIEYLQDKNVRSQKIYDSLNIKDLFTSIQVRAAWGRFGIVYEYTIGQIFELKDEKNAYVPSISGVQKIGIAIDLL